MGIRTGAESVFFGGFTSTHFRFWVVSFDVELFDFDFEEDEELPLDDDVPRDDKPAKSDDPLAACATGTATVQVSAATTLALRRDLGRERERMRLPSKTGVGNTS